MHPVKRLLVLNFFPAFVPPQSGGELRYFYFYEQLSRRFDITLLSPTYGHHRAERIDHSPRLREYRVPKEPIHDELHARLDERHMGPEYSALVCALSARYPNAYHRRYLELYPQADLIVHEFPYMLEYDLFFGHDRKPRIYNSHNFESRLVEQLWTGSDAAPYIEHVKRLERQLASHCNLVFAVSPEEREAMIREFELEPERVLVGGNGIHPDQLQQPIPPIKAEGRLRALFVGSHHPPNREAVDFIVSTLAPACPNIDFVIAGSCCQNLQQPTAANVRWVGPFAEEDKKTLFREADIALNPLFSGAGTNLKALEYMASGLPLISTETGARGLGLKAGVHYLLATKTDMASKLNRVRLQMEELQRLAEAAQHHVQTHFTWPRIVSRFMEKLETLPAEQPVRPLLVLNDFAVKDASFGGAVRIRELYSVLSEYHPVLLITLHNRPTLERTRLGPHFTELSVPKTPEHIAEENRQNCYWDVSVHDIVTSYMAPANPLLRQLVASAASAVSAVILAHPYMANLIDRLDSVPIVYEAHNFEYQLKAQLLDQHPRRNDHLQRIRQVENRAVSASRFLVCVSPQDGLSIGEFYRTHKDFVVIANGIHTRQAETVAALCQRPAIRKLFHGHPVAAFIGSNHKPNIQAAQFIVNRLAPELPQAYFCVIGDVCHALSEVVPDNVIFMGRVPENHKNVLLAMADIAINPVWEGSGSNLKLAEYFCFSLPTVTSDFGARGYRVTDGHEVLVASPEDFAPRIKQLLTDSALRQALATNAHRYVQRYHDWQQLGRQYRDTLCHQLFSEESTKVLVVTHRFTRPPLGGAEWYLLNLLEAMARDGSIRFDIVCPAVYQIANRYHFATSLTPLDAPPLEVISPGIAVRRFPYQELPEPQIVEHCRQLFQQWYQEFIQVSLAHLEHYPCAMLLGGWNFPEKQADRTTQIWSSQRSLFFLPQIRVLRVDGYSPRRKTITFSSAGKRRLRQSVSGHWTVELPVGPEKVVELTVDRAHHERRDPRTLGVLVQRVQVTGPNDEKRDLPLDYGYRDWLKENRLQAYLQSLIQGARQRPREKEQSFQAVRGPHSSAMTDWLRHNTANYDLVIGHCVPFRPVVEAAEAAMASGKPLVVLPHFHFDDEFYHWRTYYRALTAATSVLAFPRQALDLFFEPLGSAARYLPGGGVFPEEFAADHRHHLDQLYRPARPYFLVLGRKSPSKNYQWAIEAIDELNRNERMCELLMIGPDDDGIHITGPHTRYLGPQPRQVVLGALQGCVALINMSSSESFGIVILEAWMAQKPVVVNKKCAAFRELVTPGVDGLLVEREQLAASLLQLLNSPTTTEAMGNAGHRKADQGYSWDQIATQAGRWIKTLCAPGKAAGTSRGEPLQPE